MLFGDSEGIDNDIDTILTFIRGVYAPSGTLVNVDVNKIVNIVESMYIDFPHQAGLDKARSFKKAATFVCLFVGERPFVNSVTAK